jgi:hypothetical protein
LGDLELDALVVVEPLDAALCHLLTFGQSETDDLSASR